MLVVPLSGTAQVEKFHHQVSTRRIKSLEVWGSVFSHNPTVSVLTSLKLLSIHSALLHLTKSTMMKDSSLSSFQQFQNSFPSSQHPYPLYSSSRTTPSFYTPIYHDSFEVMGAGGGGGVVIITEEICGTPTQTSVSGIKALQFPKPGIPTEGSRRRNRILTGPVLDY